MIGYLGDWSGIKLTKEQYEALLDENPEIRRDIEEMGADTCNRESLMNVLGVKITGMCWPCNGDPAEEKQKFFKLLRENASKLGYEYKED